MILIIALIIGFLNPIIIQDLNGKIHTILKHKEEYYDFTLCFATVQQ